MLITINCSDSAHLCPAVLEILDRAIKKIQNGVKFGVLASVIELYICSKFGDVVTRTVFKRSRCQSINQAFVIAKCIILRKSNRESRCHVIRQTPCQRIEFLKAALKRPSDSSERTAVGMSF